MDSIEGKTNKIFIPNISRFTGNLKGKEINCAWMDEKKQFFINQNMLMNINQSIKVI